MYAFVIFWYFVINCVEMFCFVIQGIKVFQKNVTFKFFGYLLHELLLYVLQVVPFFCTLTHNSRTWKSLPIDVHIEYLQTLLDVLLAYALLDCLLLSHSSHCNSFLFWMPCTLFMWCFRVLSSVKNFVQFSKEYFLGDSLCSLWWWFKPTRLANDLGHLPHLKGFSSRICSVFSWYFLIAESAKIL